LIDVKFRYPTPHRLLWRCLLEVGTWLSLVEHSLGVRGVGSSNLPVPTNQPAISTQPSSISFFACRPTKHLKGKTLRSNAKKVCEGSAGLVFLSNLPVPTNRPAISTQLSVFQKGTAAPGGTTNANSMRVIEGSGVHSLLRFVMAAAMVRCA
jgi:hypothetical protein